MTINFDTVVDVDSGLFPFRILITTFREGFKGRLIDGFIDPPASGGEFLECAIVKFL